MMRQKGSMYHFGRTEVLMKVKPHFDDEAKVLGYKKGKGKYSDEMGAIHGRLRNGNKLLIGNGFTDDIRANPPPVGSIVTFRYCDCTKKGVPRNATFVRVRPDVDEHEF